MAREAARGHRGARSPTTAARGPTAVCGSCRCSRCCSAGRISQLFGDDASAQLADYLRRVDRASARRSARTRWCSDRRRIACAARSPIATRWRSPPISFATSATSPRRTACRALHRSESAGVRLRLRDDDRAKPSRSVRAIDDRRHRRERRPRRNDDVRRGAARDDRRGDATASRTFTRASRTSPSSARPPITRAAADGLRAIGYEGWVSIEMRAGAQDERRARRAGGAIWRRRATVLRSRRQPEARPRVAAEGSPVDRAVGLPDAMSDPQLRFAALQDDSQGPRASIRFTAATPSSPSRAASRVPT